MQQIVVVIVLSCCLSVEVGADDFAARRKHNWHQWRGPAANGVALHGNPPLVWNEKTNIGWKVVIPGEGSSTPIVWENQVFVLSAVVTDRKADSRPALDPRAKTAPPPLYLQYVVHSIDRETGQTLWKRIACEETPHEGRHPTNTYASASPTTDGKRLYVSFGSRGVFCFDLSGKLLWKRDLGNMRTRYGWGEATSPVVHGDSLIVNWDHEDQSFIIVLDTKTGKTKWKVERDEPTSWATPLVVQHQGRMQTIVNGTNRVRSYDLETGEIIWQCGGQTVNAIPSPVIVGDVVICMSGYRGSAVVAIPLGATGDLTGTDQVVWSRGRGTPYVPSPILYGRRLYFTRTNSALLSCLDAATGEPIFEQQRLPGLRSLYASPAGADGRIYIVDRDGTTLVIKDAPKFEVLATNKLDDPIDASPAIVGKQLFLRGSKHLYCIEAATDSPK